MASFGEPVAQNVNVNPNQGLTTLSNLLSIKQQKLALETGQALKSSAESEAVTRGVEAKGKTEVAGFLQGFDFAKHIGTDGTLDMNSALSDPKFEGLGPGKEAAANALLGIKNNQIKNKADMATLRQSVVKGGSMMVGAIAADPDVVAGNAKGIEKALAQLDVIDDTYPDQGKALTSKLRGVISSGHIKPEDLSAALRAFQMQGEDVSQQQQQQNPQGITNAAGQVVNRNVQTGALSAPGQSQPSLNPASPQIAGQTAAATGGVASDVETYNTIRTAGVGATAVRGLAQQVAQMAKDVDTGPTTGATSKLWSGVLQRFGYKPTDLQDVGVRRAVLGKLAAQLLSQAEASAPSDAVRQAIAKGYPDPDHMPAGAVIEAARYVDGVAAINQQRLANAEAYKKTHGGVVTGLSTHDSGFAQSADPLAAHYAALDPAGQKKYLEEHFKDKDGKIEKAAVIRFIQNVNGLKHSAAQNKAVLGDQ